MGRRFGFAELEDEDLVIDATYEGVREETLVMSH